MSTTGTLGVSGSERLPRSTTASASGACAATYSRTEADHRGAPAIRNRGSKLLELLLHIRTQAHAFFDFDVSGAESFLCDGL
jgi:hypothetical protein